MGLTDQCHACKNADACGTPHVTHSRAQVACQGQLVTESEKGSPNPKMLDHTFVTQGCALMLIKLISKVLINESQRESHQECQGYLRAAGVVLTPQQKLHLTHCGGYAAIICSCSQGRNKCPVGCSSKISWLHVVYAMAVH